MHPTLQIADITRVIQLAVAPVFLLTAIGTILAVLSGRLARIVDRARVVNERRRAAGAADRAPWDEELAVLLRRRHLVNMAITAGVLAALLVCSVIAEAFVGYILGVQFSTLLAVLFIAAMVGIMSALVLFLREVLVAVGALRLDVR